jgi:hypothetical protein
VETALGVAVKVTGVPEMKSEVHVSPHAMPGTSLVTFPPPFPAFVTVRVWVMGPAIAGPGSVATSEVASIIRRRAGAVRLVMA